MRLIRSLGIFAAAMTIMALVGISPASADETHVVLCEKAELQCENPFPNPTTIVAHAKNPKLLTVAGTVECEKSLAELTLLNELSELGIGHLSSLSFEGNCHLGSTSCTVTVTGLGLVSFTKSGSLSASAKSTGGTTANVKCGFFLNCTYGGEPSLAAHSSAVGATHLLAAEVWLTATGILCYGDGVWDADYLALGTMWIES